MSTRTSYRRHSNAFKLQLCNDIREGTIGRRVERVLGIESTDLR